jgi:hypothetical protein
MKQFRTSSVVILGDGGKLTSASLLAARHLKPLSAPAPMTPAPASDEIPSGWFLQAINSAAGMDKVLTQLDPMAKPVIEAKAKELLENDDKEGMMSLLENARACIKDEEENGPNEARQKLGIPLSDWILSNG